MNHLFRSLTVAALFPGIHQSIKAWLRPRSHPRAPVFSNSPTKAHFLILKRRSFLVASPIYKNVSRPFPRSAAVSAAGSSTVSVRVPETWDCSHAFHEPPTSAAVSKTSRSALQRSWLLRLVPLCPAHSRAPYANRFMVPMHAKKIERGLSMNRGGGTRRSSQVALPSPCSAACNGAINGRRPKFQVRCSGEGRAPLIFHLPSSPVSRMAYQ